ncbi:EF-hand calcium-binding domain-containing protein 4B isoform X2 [Bombina bombina]|uniref:EF-hand calcium-binding domain-containing protein 4B isoform X2 n=1 Tax=Bombina bombina TaxID=8345 RepID=UPI00235B1D92|nr:EF-hand calcium-binding domain-containing protein 4B isoform X2 [Bombina bombina]
MEERRKSKGRKLGSSRRLKNQKNDEEEIKTEMKTEEDAFFDEMMEKIKSVLSEEGEHSTQFISRNDMEKVSTIVFSSAEELELLFDDLNSEGSGYLTYEEFTTGLRTFIHADKSPWSQKRKRKSTKRITEFSTLPTLEEADDEERKQFMTFMEHLGANNIFEAETDIWKLWTKLGHDEPYLLENLEEFLAKVTSQIKEARQEKETLEMVLKKRISEHNEEVQHLYEEMEQQMNEETKRLRNESDTRKNIHNKEMKEVMDIKNREVQQLVAVQEELERQLHNLRSTQLATKTENEKLKQTNQDLEQHLEKIRDQLSEAQGCISEMRQKVNQSDNEHCEKEEKNDIDELILIPSSQIFFQELPHNNKSKEAEDNTIEEVTDTQVHDQGPEENVTENPLKLPDTFPSLRKRVISIEEDPIPECLNKEHKSFEKDIQDIQEEPNIPLHEHNMQLMPQEISVEAEKMFLSGQNQDSSSYKAATKSKDPLEESYLRAIHEKYNIPEGQPRWLSLSDTQHKPAPSSRLIQNNETLGHKMLLTEVSKVDSITSYNILPSSPLNKEDIKTASDLEICKQQVSDFEKTNKMITNIEKPIHHNDSVKETDTEKEKTVQNRIINKKSDVAKENVQILKDVKNEDYFHDISRKPDHVYKILFVGNSNVGKTSFLHRLHEGSYLRDTSATVGVDYRIKTLIVDNKCFALQLWDTAGQERFHCITEQFFRKADGVVVMYDVTSQDTFTAVRYWLNCIREKAYQDVAILLIGNKIDCDSKRMVSTEDGEKLSQEYKLLYKECSAVSGTNMVESLCELVRCLKKNEEDMKNNVLTLKTPPEKKKSCCF